MDKLMDNELNSKLLNYGIWLLSRKEYSEREIRDKFIKKEYDPKECEDVIEYLKDRKYISDERFAESYIRYGLNNKWGLGKIKQKILYEKGISKEILNIILEDLQIDETENIKNIINTKYRKLDISDPKSKQKIFRGLASKGFQINDIIKAIDEIKKAT